MEYLGSRNIFFSEYVIGTRPPINEDIHNISTLHKWLKFKDEDYGMEQYNTDNTQYIAILNIIDLRTLESIFKDLVLIYKKHYPFGEKQDFIDHLFVSTIFDLKQFIEKDGYFPYGTPNYIELDFYFRYSKSDGEYIDYGIDPTKDIEYYKQYYKKVLQLIENIDFDNISSEIETTVTPKYNTNHFNNDSAQLFEFLIESYEKEGKVKFINIFYFLKKYVATNHQDQFRFTIKQNEYKLFIEKQFGITIKKFESAKIEFEDKEVPKLKDLFKIFKVKLNREQNT